MRKNVTLCALLFLSVSCSVLTSCMTSSQVYLQSGHPGRESGQVVVYRVAEPTGSRTPFIVLIDGEQAASLTSGSYFVHHLPAGEHSFSVNFPACPNEPTFSYELKGGEVVFVRISYPADLQMDVFPEGYATTEITFTRPVRALDEAALREIATRNVRS